MNLVWCMIALVLTGTDDPTPTQTPLPGSPPAVESEKEVWSLKLQDAIRISLDNSEIVRVVSFGAQGIPVGCDTPGKKFKLPTTTAVDLANGYKPEDASSVITEVGRDVNISRFNFEIMAHVRSAEQTYWNLAQAQCGLCCAEQAVRLAREVVDKEQDELLASGCCRGGCADVAEATKRLEQFQRELVKQTSEVVESERRLRFILGLPADDNRRIVPVTSPIELHVVFDRETCREEMMQQQADITQQQLFDKAQQTMARLFPQVETGYQEYIKAKRLRVAANKKLQSQRGYYDEGRITADRYLDAVAHFTAAVTAEHQWLVTYNITMAGLSESKGTLLSERNIVVARPARPTEAQHAAGRAKDDRATQASFVRPVQVVEEPAVRNDPVRIETNAEPECDEIWPMTVQEAIAVALDNSEIVRVISLGDRGIPIQTNCFDPPTQRAPRPPLPAGVPDGVNNDGQSFVIARLNADATSFRFKSAVMADVRTVEQRYWALGQAHAALWAADQAVNMARDVVETMTDADVQCDRVDELAEASERLGQFEHALVDRTSDVIVAERAFRTTLGLPETYNRRIIPVTPPSHAPLEPDWETCLAEMTHQQPDIIQQKLLTRLAELQLVITRHAGLPQESLNAVYEMNALGQTLDSHEDTLMSTFLGSVEMMSPRTFKRFTRRLARSSSEAEDVLELVERTASEPPQMPRRGMINTRQAQYKLLRSRAFLGQVVHQTTHSLAHGFLDVDAGYKYYATAERLRRAAEQQLQAQRAEWDEGRITTDRLLDAVEQYAILVANEHRYLAAYNSAIAFLSECKGTLLADHNIIVAESPRRGEGQRAARAAPRRSSPESLIETGK